GPAAPVLLAGVCGTLPFLRPELTLLSALLLPLPVIRVWRQGAKPAVIARLALRCALVAAVAAAPWCLWQLLSTGSVVPATIAAKRCYFAESQVPAAIKWLRVEGSLLDLLRACGPLCVAALLLPFTPAGRSALLFTALMLAAYYLEFPGALTHAQGRYLYILTPFLLYAVASAFRLLKRRPVPKRWMALFTLVAAVQTLLLAPFTWREHEAENYATRRDLVATARWCRQNLPPGSRLLIHDAGYISYGTSFEMQDLVGLKTPANIALHRALTYPSGGANRPAAIDAAARRAHADYLVVLDIWDGIFRITDSLRQHGWKLDQVSPDGAYRVYRLSAPQQPVSPPAATSSDIGHTATSETFAEGAGRPPHTSETPPIGGP
ncbi:MAG TPA: hypothetical protein VKT77_13140, partial [Chthonomonadaceae bacterium]|nr:hypothetical protein [Chthonomonadaceae bacterium]